MSRERRSRTGKRCVLGAPKRRLLHKWSFFFFQAEDGIRDLTVTGVQTCALPISDREPRAGHGGECRGLAQSRSARVEREARHDGGEGDHRPERLAQGERKARSRSEKASWRGREEISVGGGSFKKKKHNNLYEDAV